ncbi:MAG: prepilin-type N-terminal cleavage/methylation domain-containing protein, partial [Myxococcota bacterium]
MIRRHHSRSAPFHGGREESGLTLLELMVSTVLISLFLAAATTAFLANGRLHRSQN